MSLSPVSPELKLELLDLIRKGHTVAAVKKLREATGISLGKCLKAVHTLLDEMIRADSEGRPKA